MRENSYEVSRVRPSQRVTSAWPSSVSRARQKCRPPASPCLWARPLLNTLGAGAVSTSSGHSTPPGGRVRSLVTEFIKMWREDKRDISSDQRGPAPAWASATPPPPPITLLLIITPTLAVITLSSPRQGSTPLWSDPHPNKHINFLTENMKNIFNHLEDSKKFILMYKVHQNEKSIFNKISFIICFQLNKLYIHTSIKVIICYRVYLHSIFPPFQARGFCPEFIVSRAVWE